MEKILQNNGIDVTRLTAQQLERIIKKAASDLEYFRQDVRIHMSDASGHHDLKEFDQVATSTGALKLSGAKADQVFKDASLAFQELESMSRTYPRRPIGYVAILSFRALKEDVASIDRMRIKNGG